MPLFTKSVRKWQSTENAGAIVTDWSGNKIFPVNLDNYTGESFRTVAACKKTHPEIMNALK